MKLLAFEPAHALALKLQPRQRHAIAELPLEYLSALQHGGVALTAVSRGTIVACGGIARTEDYGTLWGYLSSDATKDFVALDRIVRKLLKSCELQAVHATVQADFTNGGRWLRLLGFSYKRLLVNYGLYGEDQLEYVWCNSSR